ncbi:MAG TPA: lipoyl synthase [Bacteroidales bacterium]|nr:lipoyl synthase [Bacteroidales bacterium]
MEENKVSKIQKPAWLKTNLPTGKVFMNLRDLVKEHKLHTICESGKCPNMGECWGAGTATFMILGNICTRSCRFCNVATGKPLPVDMDEPKKVANSIKIMKLKHAVITSVDRDDLPDGGAGFWAETIREIKAQNPTVTIETLVPDFQGQEWQIKIVADAKPEIISHNIETVRRMTKLVRVQAKYDRSLQTLQTLHSLGCITKSGIMLGIGETDDEVVETLHDLFKVGVQIVTIGQYLQPTKKHLPVDRFVTPEKFAEFKKIGLEIGFKVVESGPLVRSSYHAEKHLY